MFTFFLLQWADLCPPQLLFSVITLRRIIATPDYSHPAMFGHNLCVLGELQLQHVLFRHVGALNVLRASLPVFTTTPRQDLKKLKKLKNLTTVLRLEPVLRSDPKPTFFFVRFLIKVSFTFVFVRSDNFLKVRPRFSVRSDHFSGDSF